MRQLPPNARNEFRDLEDTRPNTQFSVAQTSEQRFGPPTSELKSCAANSRTSSGALAPRLLEYAILRPQPRELRRLPQASASFAAFRPAMRPKVAPDTRPVPAG